jgi:hypothetical protein
MVAESKYASCGVSGKGKLVAAGHEKSEKFRIIDMSASEINIETMADIPEGMPVKLRIQLNGMLVDVHMDVRGTVTGRIDNGYRIELIDLPESDREEIDEMMRSACNIN